MCHPAINVSTSPDEANPTGKPAETLQQGHGRDLSRRQTEGNSEAKTTEQ
jgi:hypothetical protein